MTTGKRQVSFALVVVFGMLVAAGGRDAGADIPAPARCAETLQFERLGIEVIDSQPQWIPARRLVKFEWQPHTSELSFSTRATAAITLPEDFVTVASFEPAWNCE